MSATEKTIQNAHVTDYPTFEAYLDSQITAQDMFYLPDRQTARELMALGYRVGGEPLKESEFIARKANTGIPTNGSTVGADESISYGLESIWKNDAFLKGLADRELLIRNGKLMTIIFIRAINDRGSIIQCQILIGRARSEWIH